MSDHAERDAVDRILEQWARERPELDSSPVAVVGRMHRLGDRLRHAIVARYADFGLGEGEFDVLATLRRHGAPYALQPNALAAQTMVTTGGLTKRVDRLVAAGLVSRAAGPGDGRTRSIALTGEGRARIDEAYEAHLENERGLLAALGADDRAALEGILRRWSLAIEADA